MRISVGLPTCMEGMIYPIPFASPEQIIQIAKHAEALGYHSIWGNDHMTTQKYVRQEYSEPPNYWEPLVTYANIAAETQSLRLGTGVLVMPMRRDIVVVAKQVTTLDHFSGGRLMLGLGIGAYREEFEALHPTWDVHRGDLIEESIQALKLLFEERVVSWKGTYYHVEDVEMFPKPLQDPLPLYIGGNNPNAVRRTALYADGWMPAGMPIHQLREHIAHLEELTQEHGRDFDQIDVAPQLVVYIGRTHETAVEHFQRSQMYHHLVSLSTSTLKDQAGMKFEEANLIGTASEIVEKVQALREAGVTHVAALLFAVNTVDEMLEQMQIFAEEVKPCIQSSVTD